MSLNKYLKTMASARSLFNKKKYSDAIKKIDSANKLKLLPASCLILKGQILHFVEKGKLSDIRKLYLDAIKIEPTSLDSLIEMAHFEDAIMNNPKKAIKYCKELLDVSKRYQIEANKLMKECKKQL